MADERYEWLDADAAERLLRGEPVESFGDHAGADARRLAAALGEARTVPPADRELPGEAAVLAAFRDASRARGRGSGAGAHRAVSKRPDTAAGIADHTVRIGGAHTVPPRRPRWSRPLRYGLVASLAGCALGGVAVAAGTGMLPGPFGGQGSPVPAVSVSAAASPEELGSGLPSGAGPSVAPSGSPSTSEPPAAPDTPDEAATGAGTGDAPSGRAGGEATHGGTPDGGGGRDGAPEGTDDGNGLPDGSGDGGNSGELYDKSVQACRDYRDGTLDRENKRRLVRLAKSESNLERFCDRVLGERDPGSGTGDGRDDSHSGSGDESGGGGGDESGSGAPDLGEGSEGTLPSVSFDRTPPSPEASGTSETSGASGASGNSEASDDASRLSGTTSPAPSAALR